MFVKKIIAMLFVLCIIAGLNTSALDNGPPDITIMVGMEKVEFEDQEPIIKEDRTLVPIRSVFEQMGAEVEWNDEEKSATVQYEENTVLITIGSNIVLKNDSKITIDVPAEIINERTMLPLRAIAEALDWHVYWGETSRRVSLYRFDPNNPHDMKVYEYIERPSYITKEFIHTVYGTVVYGYITGTPHGAAYWMWFIDTNGEVHGFYDMVPRLTPWVKPKCDNLTLSDDERILSFSVSFEERAVMNVTEREVVLHEAGTYYFMADLETKQCELTMFKPIDE